MKRASILAVLALLPPSAFGALTLEQKEQDFELLSAIYAKRYAPANWKIQALGVNVFDIRPWMKQVRESKSDLEFIEIMMRYTASFQDTHVSMQFPSNYVARLGMSVDLYDGKAVIELITRAQLPATDYPFVAGDELVSIDGRPTLDIAREYALLQGQGNPRAALRLALARVTTRPQSALPRAIDTPDESTVVIRRQSGDLETYKIAWVKSGTPIREVGGVPSPFQFRSGVRFSEPYVPSNSTDPEQIPTWQRDFYARAVSAVSKDMSEPQGETVVTEEGVHLEPRALLNYGSRFPWFSLPSGFQTRVGNAATDFFYTGTFTSEGLRMGYLRFPSFPQLSLAQRTAFENEVAFLNENTDGLVVDVARNTGGLICGGADLAAALIPGGLKYAGLAFRPWLPLIVNYDTFIANARAQGAPSWVIDLYEFERKMLMDAYVNGRSLAGPIPICNLAGYDYPSVARPYSKPLIVLVDDFSTSTGDYFPSLIQDNKRGQLVGMRTNGAGGSVNDLTAGIYSETFTRVTASLMVRPEERETTGFPKSPFIENVGVRPDIELDYMTVENVINSGRPYSNAFARILAEEIRKAQP